MPHAHGRAYDGQFYAQLALDPLLRDAAIDRAMDAAPYRARRILFSWTAYVLGGGEPWRVLQAYALQNVVCWLLLGALLTRWVPPETAAGFALWAACMLSNGLLWSMRMSLVDGPSLLLIACAVRAAESARPWLAAPIVGVAGLARETNLSAITLLRMPRTRRDLAIAGGCAVLIAMPLLVWQDYLWSIYRTNTWTGSSQLGTPFVAYAEAWRRACALARTAGVSTMPPAELLVPLSLTVQAAYLLFVPRPNEKWWRVAVPYVVLMMLVAIEVWPPEAITRVLLPMTFAFNVLLFRAGRTAWAWMIAGNLPLLFTLDPLVWPGLARWIGR